nr:polyprenyl synthetase family protein [Rhodococcus rhodnii]
MRAPTARTIGASYAAGLDALSRFVLRGGKRVRPAFAWTGWVGAGGDPAHDAADAVVSAVSSLELIQGCALVHDDIIDASTTRRGFPTVHVEYAGLHREQGWSGDPLHFGTSAAILLGDLALAMADDMLRESGIDDAALRRAQPVWSAMRTEVLGGQFLDIVAEASRDESIDTAYAIDRYKTAAYTIERPLHLGAAIAGADEGLVASYREFGTDIGVAFQLRDDLLGVFGDPELTGKPSGDDLRAGKRTVLVASALETADRDDPVAAADIRASLGTALTDGDVARLRARLTDLGAVADVEAQIDRLTGRALTALAESTATPDAKDALAAMAETATRRTA